MSERKNVVIVAGAGAGKTWALVDEYLRTLLGLLPGDEEARGPERILAVTFTEKAAHEMRARVLQRLAALRFEPDTDPLASAHTLAPRVLEGLRRAVATAPILTFHALCGRVLRDHALAAGVDPRFAILEPLDERRLLVEVTEAVVIDAVRAGDPRVAELVARVGLRGFGDRPALVECLVQVTSSLAERGLTADELALADASRLDVDDELREARTAVGPLRAHERGMAAGQGLDVLTAALRAAPGPDDDPEPRVAAAFSSLRGTVGGNWGGPKLADARRALVARIERLGAALVDAAQVGLSETVRDLVREIGERVRSEKDARGVLGFGDLLVRTRDVLRDVPGVRARVAGRFDRVLVDEFQDTSPVQEDVLAFLAEGGGAVARVPRGEPAIARVVAKPGRVLVVGDPRQSIYGFRGADPQVLSRALTHLAGAGGERRDLDVCRRSLDPIVSLANLVATHALPGGTDGVPLDQLQPMTALRGGEGVAGAHLLVGAGAEHLPPHEREALVVARELADLFTSGAASPQDVAILVRRQKAAGPLARALGRAGILADVVGGDGFWQRPEVSDVVCALALALDPHDELSVLAVLRSPFLCATDDEVLALYEHLPDDRRFLSWPRALVACDDDALDRSLRDRMQRFDALLRTVRAHVFSGRSARALDLLLDDGGYAAAVAVESDGAVRERNLHKLRALLDARGDDALVGIARLGDLLDEKPAEAVASARLDGGDDRQAVRIMTIHQAKGLEFPVVVVADAGSGLKGESDDVALDMDVGLAVTARGRPIAACVARTQARTAPTAIQRVRRRLRERSESELARVLYVALTRARDRLYVVGAPRRQGTGSLAGILDRVRATAPDDLGRLLPQRLVDARLPDAPLRPAPAVDDAPALDLAPPPRFGAGPVRVRASELLDAPSSQTTLFGPDAGEVDALDDEERLPPRAAGRLGHALIALGALELAPQLDDEPALRHGLLRAARALGVRDSEDELPPSVLDGVLRTLRGPVRALRDRGARFAFEERLQLVRGNVVVEGRADLVARMPGRTVVVELKRTAARAARAELQAAAYAAALLEVEEQPVYFARWAIGEEAPAEEAPFRRVADARLDAALARLDRDRVGR